MTTHEIVVTDVTCYGQLYCVAGWDRLSDHMIRPEPPGANAKTESSRFWDGRFAGLGKTFSVGNVVRFVAGPALPDFLFPHATEDRIVDLGTPMVVLNQLTPPQIAQAVATGVSATLNAAFDGALVRPSSRKAYVPMGHYGRSLGAIEIAPAEITFFENTFDTNKPKLRARVTSDGNVYDLSVPADATRTRWKVAGLSGLRADVQVSNRIHIRVGLSRPFLAKPNDCYSQVNGVLFL